MTSVLAPATPMLFQGQEFGSSRPFLFFADHNPELARLVREGRGRFLAQFPSLATAEMQSVLADPADPKWKAGLHYFNQQIATLGPPAPETAKQ